MIQTVAVLGGGTAGWLSAALIGAKQKPKDPSLKVLLIESPNIKTIGVGEGTWPSMRSTLQQIGINEQAFIKECNVSLKQGSQFVAWKNGQTDDYYYHPFVTPNGYYELDLYTSWQQHAPQMSFSEYACVQSHVCEHSKAPKQFATPDYAGVTSYGYHLDAGKFANMLKKHCITNLGVEYISDDIDAVLSDENNDICALVGKNHGEIKLDMMLDCSGLSGLVIEKHYGVKMKSCQHILFNDSALTAHVPYQNEHNEIASATVSTAQEAGWVWDIGLQTRRGVGYTFSSAHTSDEQAESVLRRYIKNTHSDELANTVKLKKLSFSPGYREKFWVNNCLAIGMSSGFFEPLEASALAMVELSLTMLTDEFPRDRQHMQILSERFNTRFSYRWERVVDFLKLHYVLNQRDEPYWKEARSSDSIPDSLKKLMSLWQYQPPNRHDLTQNEEVFPSASYQYVLYGMGFTPKHSSKLSEPASQLSLKLLKENQYNQQQFNRALPSNREFVNYIKGKVA